MNYDGSHTPLLIKRYDSGQVTTFVLEGDIDEHANLQRITEMPNKQIYLNLKSVSRVNSVGVKIWINALRMLPGSSEVFLMECSVPVVLQANMIKNFVGTAKVLSFFAPYYCSQCDVEFKYLLDIKNHFPTKKLKAPITKCVRCGEQLDFDDIESDYFQIVVNHGVAE